MTLTKRVELGLNRRDAVGIDLRESIDRDDQIGHGRLNPVDRFEDALVLVGERPVPNRFVMENTVAQFTHFVKTLDQVGAGSMATWHVRERCFYDRRPQHLLVTAIQ